MFQIVEKALDFNIEGYSTQDVPLMVVSCGLQKCVTDGLVIERPKGRIDFQLIYIATGSITLTDTQTIIPENYFILFYPNEPQFYHPTIGVETEMYWVHFSGSHASGYFESLVSTQRNRAISPIDGNACIPFFTAMIKELREKRNAFSLGASAHLQLLLTHLFRSITNTSSNQDSIDVDDVVIQTAIDYIHQAYNQPLTVDMLASRCSLSKYWFLHRFKAQTNTTPIQYLTRVRMEQAKYLLLESTLTIDKIATTVGYSNALYFSKVFKKEVGVAPTSFRKRL